MEKKNGKKQSRQFLYAAGTLILASAALVLAPRVIGRLSDRLYAAPAPAPEDEESWGPEIVETGRPEEPAAEEAPAGETETGEETDGEF